MPPPLLAVLVTYAGWLLMSLLLLRRSLLDGRFPVPAMALALSLSWDLVLIATPAAGAITASATPVGAALLFFSRTWLPLDLAALYVALRCRDDGAPARPAFWGAFALLLAVCTSALLAAARREDVPVALLHGWVATGIKCLWSSLLLASLWRSRDGRGQSPGAWVVRFSLCTVAPLLIAGVPMKGAAFAALIALDALLDAAYLPLYLVKRRAMAAARA